MGGEPGVDSGAAKIRWYSNREGRYPFGERSPDPEWFEPIGFPPPWHVDFVTGKAWELSPSDELALVRHDGSDVKAVWELSRLQFLPVLGKAYCLTSDERFREAAMLLFVFVSIFLDLFDYLAI